MAKPGTSGLSNMVVWIIDDDAIDRFILDRMLSLCNNVASISYFSDGREVIQRLASDDSEYPNVIFLDINMPVMDGWQFLNAYSRLPDKTKNKVSIVVTSSSVSESDRICALKNPDVRHFVVKPFNQVKLVQAMGFAVSNTAAPG